MTKKQIRATFRESVFGRDKNKCRMCGEAAVDAHHIIDRNLLPNGGYVKENGISLCEACHIKAEQFHATGVAAEGYSPEDLFTKIGSSEKLAREKSEKL